MIHDSNDEVHAIILQALRRLEDKVDYQGRELVALSTKFKLWSGIFGTVFGAITAFVVSLLKS